MHVAFICDEYPPGVHGGVGSLTQTIARRVVEEGHRATVIGTYRSTHDLAELDQGVQVIRLTSRGRVRGVRALADQRRLWRRIARVHAADPIDRVNGRPNFEMMVYPGGDAPRKIPADAPPLFLICANDDEYGCDKVSMALLEKFRAAHVSVEAHMIAAGKHAFNMGDRSTFAAIRHWPDRMAEWMGDRGLLTPAGAAKR